MCKTFIDTLWYNCLTISVDIQILYGCSLQFPSGVPGLDKMVMGLKDWKGTDHCKVISRKHTVIVNKESKSVINNPPFSIIGYEMGDFTLIDTLSLCIIYSWTLRSGAKYVFLNLSCDKTKNTYMAPLRKVHSISVIKVTQAILELNVEIKKLTLFGLFQMKI